MEEHAQPVDKDDRRRAAAQAALARMSSTAGASTAAQHSPAAAPAPACAPVATASPQGQAVKQQSEATRVDAAARDFNRHLVAIVDYKHNHPQHVLAAVKLIARVISDLQRSHGRSLSNADEPVRRWTCY